MEAIKQGIINFLNQHDLIESTLTYARDNKYNHEEVVGAAKSLETIQYILLEQLETQRWTLTSDGEDYVNNGTPEKRLFDQVPAEGVKLKDLQKDELTELGRNYGKIKGWFIIEDGILKRNKEEVVDEDLTLLMLVKAEQLVSIDTIKYLKKRQTVKLVVTKYYKLSKGPRFSLLLPKLCSDITTQMIIQNTWQTLKFKKFNANAKGKEIEAGNLHPLMKVRTQFAQVLLEMGFQEMPTNQYVESSFWNFDTLFQPQSHPARDYQDTFFIKNPPIAQIPNKEDWEKIRNVHEKGGYGSKGWGYQWSSDEAQKNILRTHTTATSSRMLYRVAKEKEFKPKKYFSIDRVFRNENLDATHLAEFHQIEGLIADRGLGFSHLKTVISVFFQKVGIEKIKFKPTYNPYTEPSAEIFGFHPILNKWVEIGNSGVFRPEMLGPMGLPPDVSVIAWGLSLERPTMINYNISNIRELFGHFINMDQIKTNAICCFQK